MLCVTKSHCPFSAFRHNKVSMCEAMTLPITVHKVYGALCKSCNSWVIPCQLNQSSSMPTQPELQESSLTRAPRFQLNQSSRMQIQPEFQDANTTRAPGFHSTRTQLKLQDASSTMTPRFHLNQNSRMPPQPELKHASSAITPGYQLNQSSRIPTQPELQDASSTSPNERERQKQI